VLAVLAVVVAVMLHREHMVIGMEAAAAVLAFLVKEQTAQRVLMEPPLY
jgi:hypothetical protein